MRLKRWFDVRDVDLPFTESPFSAVGKVADLLKDGSVSHLELNQFDKRFGDSLSIDKPQLHRNILDAVKHGGICLVPSLAMGMDRPFSPLAEWTGSQWRLNSSASFGQRDSGTRKIAQLNARGLTPDNVANARWPASGAPTASPAPPIPERSPEPIVEPPSIIEPGFHIVRTPGTREQIKQRLFAYNLTPAIEAMFERLNPHLGGYILPGDMVVLADPNSHQCQQEEAFLMAEARKIQGTLQPLEEAQRQSLMDHWQVYEDIALAGEASDSTIDNAASAIGVTSTAGGRAIKEAREALEAIDKLYQKAMDPTNPMTREQFYALRNKHAQRLKLAMGNWVNVPLRLPRHAELKSRINIEARQQIHSTATARSGGKFQIPTISEAIIKTTLVAKLTSIGGFVGLGLDTAATQSRINQACSDGRERECTRVKYVEYGGLTIRTALSAIGGGAGGGYGAEICLAISIAPQGRIVCGVVGAVAGAVAGEKVGDKAGKGIGAMLFKGLYGSNREQ